MGLEMRGEDPADHQPDLVFLIDLEQVRQGLVHLFITTLGHGGVGKIRAGLQLAEELVGAAHFHRVHRHVRFHVGEQGDVIDKVEVNPGGVDLENFAHVLSLPKNGEFDFLNLLVGALKRQVSEPFQFFQKRRAAQKGRLFENDLGQLVAVLHHAHACGDPARAGAVLRHVNEHIDGRQCEVADAAFAVTLADVIAIGFDHGAQAAVLIATHVGPGLDRAAFTWALAE
ncbi:hypothetical protein D3C76_612410 [compost metagenome]